MRSFPWNERLISFEQRKFQSLFVVMHTKSLKIFSVKIFSNWFYFLIELWEKKLPHKYTVNHHMLHQLSLSCFLESYRFVRLYCVLCLLLWKCVYFVHDCLCLMRIFSFHNFAFDYLILFVHFYQENRSLVWP